MFFIYTCDEFNIPRSRDSLLSKSNPSYKNVREITTFLPNIKNIITSAKYVYVFLKDLLPNITSEAKLKA